MGNNSEVTKMSADTSTLSWAFPDLTPEVEPLGQRIAVQLKRVSDKSKGGLIVVKETQQTESDNMAVAKVISLGPLAYRKRDTLEPWAEKAWIKVGDFVRVPRYGGDRWVQHVEGDDQPVIFAILNDYDVIARVVGDPLNLRAQ